MVSSLREPESMVTRIDQSLAEVREELGSIESARIRKDDLTEALSSFMPIWDELYPAERVRIVNLPVERVEYETAIDRFQIVLLSPGP